jgi:hypothetical protein
VNLCFLGVAEEVWRQNIDSKDLGWKIFGISILGQNSRFLRNDREEQGQKAKEAAQSQPRL